MAFDYLMMTMGVGVGVGVKSSALARGRFIIITYPLAGGYVLFYTAVLTALSLSLSLFGITRPLLKRE